MLRRRNFTAGLLGACVASISGCTSFTFGREEFREVIIANETSDSREGKLTISNAFNGRQGTVHFDEDFILEEGESDSHSDGIPVSDGPPREIRVAMEIGGETVVDDNYDFPDEDIRISIKTEDDVAIEVDSTNRQ